MVVSLVETILDREGYRVMGTPDPMFALALAAGPRQPDLLLTDVNMPRLNGPVLARLILRNSPATKILFMTGHAPSDDRELGIPEQADVLRKPFLLGELVERVRRSLGQGSAGAAC
jgi:DNA-binding response OmpR family regulator